MCCYFDFWWLIYIFNWNFYIYFISKSKCICSTSGICIFSYKCTIYTTYSDSCFLSVILSLPLKVILLLIKYFPSLVTFILSEPSIDNLTLPSPTLAYASAASIRAWIFLLIESLLGSKFLNTSSPCLAKCQIANCVTKKSSSSFEFQVPFPVYL